MGTETCSGRDVPNTVRIQLVSPSVLSFGGESDNNEKPQILELAAKELV